MPFCKPIDHLFSITKFFEMPRENKNAEVKPAAGPIQPAVNASETASQTPETPQDQAAQPATEAKAPEAAAPAAEETKPAEPVKPEATKPPENKPAASTTPEATGIPEAKRPGPKKVNVRGLEDHELFVGSVKYFIKKDFVTEVPEDVCAILQFGRKAIRVS